MNAEYLENFCLAQSILLINDSFTENFEQKIELKI